VNALLAKPRSVLRFMKDPAAPKLPKLGILLALIYVVSPVDAIPDIMPIVGWLDDVGVLAMAYAWLVSSVNRHADGLAEEPTK